MLVKNLLNSTGYHLVRRVTRLAYIFVLDHTDSTVPKLREYSPKFRLNFPPCISSVSTDGVVKKKNYHSVPLLLPTFSFLILSYHGVDHFNEPFVLSCPKQKV